MFRYKDGCGPTAVTVLLLPGDFVRRKGGLSLQERFKAVPIARVVGVCVASILGICFSGCTRNLDINFPQEAIHGDSTRGPQFIYSYNCGSCHVIPGIAEAKGTVGPPLQGFGNRSYIAGSLANSPENLLRWIREPQRVQAGTAMPNLDVTEAQAADIAAYLYTLR